MSEEKVKKPQKRNATAGKRRTYDKLLHKSNVGIYKITPGDNGRFVDANPALVKILGYNSKKELMKLNVSDTYLDPSRRKIVNKRLYEDGYVKNEELQLKKKDGTPITAIDIGIAVHDKEGRLLYFEGILEDVTERRKSEQQSRQKAEDLSLINMLNEAVNRGDSLSDIITIMAQETLKIFPVFGTTVYLLDEKKKNLIMQKLALAKRYIRKIEKIIGSKIPEIKIPVTGDSEIVNILKRGKTVILSDKKSIYKIIADHTENPLLKKAAPAIQDILHIKSVINVPILSENTHFGVLGIASSDTFSESDIKRLEFLATHLLTIIKRKLADDALKKSEEQYRKLIDMSPESITLNDMNGKITMANQAAVEMRGYKNENELLGKNIMELVAPSEIEKARNGIQETLKQGQVKNVEYTLLKKDGTPFQADVSVSTITDSEGNPNAFMAIVRDISERKSIEKALKESEEQYRKLIETSPDPILVSDLEANIIMANQQAIEVYGCPEKEDLIGKNAFNCIALHDRKKALANYKKTLELGTLKNIEYTILRYNGTSIYAELSSSVIRDSEGNPKLIIGVLRDITKRKRIEKALRESEELYRMLIETSPFAITINDMTGKIFLVNQESVRMHKAKRKDDLIGKNAFDFIEPEDRKKLTSRMEKIIQEGGEKAMEYKLRDLAGNYIPVETTCTIIKDNQGKPQAMMALGRDISHRKRIEKELAAEKERLAVTLQSIAESVISVDTESNIVFMNRVAEKLTGWNCMDSVGKPLCDILTIVGTKNKPIDCEGIIRHVIETGRVGTTIDEAILVSKDETERVIAQSCAPIRDSEQNIIGVVLVIRDITDKERMEKELFKARKLESIGLLAGGIAHDFNNILTGITSNLFMAKMELEMGSQVYETITNAEKAAFRANKLTNQLLTFSKGGAPIKESQSIREIIEEAVGFSLSGSNVDCDLSLPKDLWSLEIDRGQIDQVITNLILNAEQAMPDGGTIRVNAENIDINPAASNDTTAFLPLEPGKYIRITVKDEGVGIRPEDLDKIYDPYFTTKDQGSGLGLTICYSIVRKHNGLIFAKSRLGAGTTLNIYLPASGIKAKESKTIKKESDLKGTGKVLLMDDEEVVRITAGTILKSIGYIVEYAKDGSEAIKKYQQAMRSNHPFDTVVMDLTVPGGMGGKEAVKKLLEIDPEVKAIVSSGYSTDPIMSEYKKYGFCGFVTKPYTVEEFNAAIKQAIAERRR